MSVPKKGTIVPKMGTKPGRRKVATPSALGAEDRRFKSDRPEIWAGSSAG